MPKIYTAEAIREWDAYTIKHEPISSIVLMERAALNSSKRILGSYLFESICFVCGQGNNGGDGLAMARIFSELGKTVTVFICSSAAQGSADFEINLKRLPNSVETTVLKPTDEIPHFKADLLVDCLFGSGLNRPIEGWLSTVIAHINQTESTTIAIDIPSGLYVYDNRNNPLVSVVRADKTLSFQTPKFPFFFAKYAPYIGAFSIIDISLSSSYKAEGIAHYITSSDTNLFTGNKFAHKGNKGFLTLIAGCDTMIGAALMSAQAAFRTGCGYVGVVSNSTTLSPLATTLPEAMWIGEDFDTLPDKTSAIAIGPGLGQSEHALSLLKKALSAQKPMVIDADAINLLVAHPALLDQLPANSILTPHIGELQRLIGIADTPEAFLDKQKAFSKKYGVYLLQKGAHSKLTTPDELLYVNSTGNSAMATAGMGDALTGMIGSFLAQGYEPLLAAINGMYYHGLAGDIAVQINGQHGLLTSDVIKKIPAALNGL